MRSPLRARLFSPLLRGLELRNDALNQQRDLGIGRECRGIQQSRPFFFSQFNLHGSILNKNDFCVGAPLSKANNICTIAACALVTSCAVMSVRTIEMFGLLGLVVAKYRV